MTSWDWTLTADPQTGRQQREIAPSGSTRSPGSSGALGSDAVRLLVPDLGERLAAGPVEHYAGVSGSASVADRFGRDQPFAADDLADVLDDVFDVLFDELRAQVARQPADRRQTSGGPDRTGELATVVQTFLADAERSGSPRAADLRRRLGDRRDRPAPRLRLSETIGLARVVPNDCRPGADVLVPAAVTAQSTPHVARICAETWLYAHLFERFGKASAASLRRLADRLSRDGLADEPTRALAAVFLLDHPRRLAAASDTPVAEIDPDQLDLELAAAAELLDDGFTRDGRPR